MANHVSSVLSFKTISEAGTARLKEIIDLLNSRDEDEYESHLGYAFVEDLDTIDRQWMCEKVGAKWAYMNDHDDDYIAMYSAWSPVEEFVGWVVSEVTKVDEEAVAVYTYEDEMPNFIGVQVYNKEGLYDAEELDSEELLENLFQIDSELKEEYSEDEGFTDKGYDILSEIQWDYISDWQYERSQEMMNFDE